MAAFLTVSRRDIPILASHPWYMPDILASNEPLSAIAHRLNPKYAENPERMRAYMVRLASCFDQWHQNLSAATHEGVWKALQYTKTGTSAHARNDPLPRLFELELFDLLYAHFCLAGWPERVVSKEQQAMTCKELYGKIQDGNHCGHARSIEFMGKWQESLKRHMRSLETIVGDPKRIPDAYTPTQPLTIEGPATEPTQVEHNFRHPQQILNGEVARWLKVQHVANQCINLGTALMVMSGFAQVSGHAQACWSLY
jgi:hypothetical protein